MQKDQADPHRLFRVLSLGFSETFPCNTEKSTLTRYDFDRKSIVIWLHLIVADNNELFNESVIFWILKKKRVDELLHISHKEFIYDFDRDFCFENGISRSF